QPDAAAVADGCRRVLAFARSAGWRVLHSQLRRADGSLRPRDHFRAPIEGLRPLVSEPVYLRDGLSAFSNRDFAAALGEARAGRVYLVGFSLLDTGLATALAAVDHGLRLTLIEDAIGAGEGHLCASTIAHALLAPFVAFEPSRSVLRSALEASA